MARLIDQFAQFAAFNSTGQVDKTRAPPGIRPTFLSLVTCPYKFDPQPMSASYREYSLPGIC